MCWNPFVFRMDLTENFVAWNKSASQFGEFEEEKEIMERFVAGCKCHIRGCTRSKAMKSVHEIERHMNSAHAGVIFKVFGTKSDLQADIENDVYYSPERATDMLKERNCSTSQLDRLDELTSAEYDFLGYECN